MLVILIFALIAAAFMAFNNGANDVANAFASAVGSKALKVNQALIIAAVLNFFGAICLGGNVAHTLVVGIANFATITNTNVFMLGMFSCLIASGFFVLVSTYTGLPVSSSHAIVGSMTGIALLLGGSSAVNWKFLGILTLSWIIMPLLAAGFALFVIKLIKLIIFRGEDKNVMKRACIWIPSFGCVVVSTLILSLRNCSFIQNFFIENKNFWTFYVVCIIPIIYLILHSLAESLANNLEHSKKGVEKIFRKFQAGTSCLVGFAIGSNDVSNSITPVLAIYLIIKHGRFPATFDNMSIPIWLLAFGGLFMSLGVLVLGSKVMATLGHKITLLNSSRGFSVDFATAATIISSSFFGLPVSSTHAATGAVIGVGLEKGWKGLNIRLLLKIFITWILTVPFAALCTIIIFSILRALLFFIL